MVALAAVLSFIRVYRLPWGGSITLLSMLPIAVYSIKRGLKAGFAASFVFSLFQLFQGITDGLFGWGLTPVMLIACILLDYVLAYTSLGIAGIFRNKGAAGWLGGTILAVFIRFLFHFLSGVVIWHSYGELYNGSYMLPEMIFTGIGAYVLFKVPQTRKLLKGDIAETEKAE